MLIRANLDPENNFVSQLAVQYGVGIDQIREAIIYIYGGENEARMASTQSLETQYLPQRVHTCDMDKGMKKAFRKHVDAATVSLFKCSNHAVDKLPRRDKRTFLKAVKATTKREVDYRI